MKYFFKSFPDSLRELKNVRCVTYAAMFTAMAIALGYLTTIQFGDIIKIGFSFLAKDFGAYMLGPVVGGIINGLVDLITFVIKPTGPFFPGFTFNAILTGIIMGSILYNRPVKLSRVLAARIVNSVVVNLFFNTLWIAMLYGNSFFVMLPARALKQVIMLPIETIMLYSVMKAAEAAGLLKLFRSGRHSSGYSGSK